MQHVTVGERTYACLSGIEVQKCIGRKMAQTSAYLGSIGACRGLMSACCVSDQ